MSRTPPPGGYGLDNDRDRLTRRIAAARNRGELDALVEVVASETATLRAERNDARNAVARVVDLVNVWLTIDPGGTMSRQRASEILRQQVEP